MPRFKDQAIVLRCYEWSETSQIVTMLTSQHGIVRGLAKGSKRTSPGAVSRYSGGFAVLTAGQVLGIIKSTTDLATLTEWDLQQPFPYLRRDLGAQRIGLYAAQATTAMLADNDPHPTVFTALSRLLHEAADTTQRLTALLRFQWRLLEDCGYRPQLPVSSHEEIHAAGSPPSPQPDRTYVFDPLHAGIIEGHSDPSPPPSRRPTRWAVNPSTVAVLRAIAAPNALDAPESHPSSDVPRTVSWSTGRAPTSLDPAARFDPQTVDRANRLLARYIRTILDRPLSTMNWLCPGIG